MTPKVKQPNEIKAVYIHDDEYFITYLMKSITLAYQPMTVRKSSWPAISFASTDQCRRIAKELIMLADQVDRAAEKTKEKKDGPAPVG